MPDKVAAGVGALHLAAAQAAARRQQSVSERIAADRANSTGQLGGTHAGGLRGLMPGISLQIPWWPAIGQRPYLCQAAEVAGELEWVARERVRSHSSETLTAIGDAFGLGCTGRASTKAMTFPTETLLRAHATGSARQRRPSRSGKLSRRRHGARYSSVTAGFAMELDRCNRSSDTRLGRSRFHICGKESPESSRAPSGHHQPGCYRQVTSRRRSSGERAPVGDPDVVAGQQEPGSPSGCSRGSAARRSYQPLIHSSGGATSTTQRRRRTASDRPQSSTRNPRDRPHFLHSHALACGGDFAIILRSQGGDLATSAVGPIFLRLSTRAQAHPVTEQGALCAAVGSRSESGQGPAPDGVVP